MTKRTGTGRGFTLIELMVVVAILGIIAAVAIPTFLFFVNRSKTSEASNNLNNLFKSAASYYSKEHGGDIGQATVGDCTVGSAGPEPASPGSNKQKFDGAGHPNFGAIHFAIADYVYFSYQIVSPGGLCGNLPGTDLYTFTAEADLDGDTTTSLFELAASSDGSNTLYHARSIYIERETE